MAEQDHTSPSEDNTSQNHLTSLVAPYPHSSSSALQNVLNHFERIRLDGSGATTPFSVSTMPFSPGYPSTPTMDRTHLTATMDRTQFTDDYAAYLYSNSNPSPAPSLLSSPSSAYSVRLRTSTYPSSPLFCSSDRADTIHHSPAMAPYYPRQIQPLTPIPYPTPTLGPQPATQPNELFLAAPHSVFLSAAASSSWGFNDRNQLVDPLGNKYEIASPLLMEQTYVLPSAMSSPVPTASLSGPAAFGSQDLRRQRRDAFAMTPSVSAPVGRVALEEDSSRLMRMQPENEPPRRARRGQEVMMRGIEQGKEEVGKEKKTRLYKTELCRSWEEKGECRYGRKCQYAHGETELRPVYRHKKYKTQICRTFWETGTCPYGVRCTFIHRDDSKANKNIIFVEDLAKEREKNERAARPNARSDAESSRDASCDRSMIDPFELADASFTTAGSTEDMLAPSASSTHHVVSTVSSSSWCMESPVSPLQADHSMHHHGPLTPPRLQGPSLAHVVSPTPASAAEEQDAFLAMLSEALNAPTAPVPDYTVPTNYPVSVSTLAAATGLDHHTIADLYFAGQLDKHLAGLVTSDANAGSGVNITTSALFESLTNNTTPVARRATIVGDPDQAQAQVQAQAQIQAQAQSRLLLTEDILNNLAEPIIPSPRGAGAPTHARRASEIATAEAQREAAGHRRRTRSLNEGSLLFGGQAQQQQSKREDHVSKKSVAAEKRLPVFKNIG